MFESITHTNTSAKSSYVNGHAFFFQPKLAINQPNDIYEQQADAMADKVMRMKEPAQQSFFSPAVFSPSFGGSEGEALQRKCAACEEEEKQIHRKKNSSAEVHTNNHFESYVNSLSSSGTSLSFSSKQFFESRFDTDFSDVKIHNDAVAAKSAASINALAYTSGNNIVFNEGQYAPGTASGDKLLAHELTHVVQQKNTVSPKIQRFSISIGCRGSDKSAKEKMIIQAFYDSEAVLRLAIATVEMLLKSDMHTPLNNAMYGFRYYFHCPGNKELGVILGVLKNVAGIIRNIEILCSANRSGNNIAQYDDIVKVMSIFPEFFEADTALRPQELVAFVLLAYPGMNWDVEGNTGFYDFNVGPDKMVMNEFSYEYALRHMYSNSNYLEDAEKLPCLPVPIKETKYCGKDATHTGRYVSVADNGDFSMVDGFTPAKGKRILEILHEGNSRFFCFNNKEYPVEN